MYSVVRLTYGTFKLIWIELICKQIMQHICYGGLPSTAWRAESFSGSNRDILDVSAASDPRSWLKCVRAPHFKSAEGLQMCYWRFSHFVLNVSGPHDISTILPRVTVGSAPSGAARGCANPTVSFLLCGSALSLWSRIHKELMGQSPRALAPSDKTCYRLMMVQRRRCLAHLASGIIKASTCSLNSELLYCTYAILC